MSRKSKRVLTLGIPKLDEAFPGFQSGDFVIFVGRPLCKLLSFLLSVRCQLPRKKGGLNSRVVYIDGGNAFDPYAVSTIAQEYELDPQSVLEKILVSRAFTAYQLTSLVFEKLEAALKRHRSKLVVISDITGLFLDRDVPPIEGRDIFLKLTQFLVDLASRSSVIVVASYVPRSYARRDLFLDSVLLGKASVVIRFTESKDGFRFRLENHPHVEPFMVDVSNSVTMDMFVEA